MIKVGDYFQRKCDQSLWILAQVEYHMAALIGLGNGNRYADPILIKSTLDIDKREWASIGGIGEFVQLEIDNEKGIEKLLWG